MSLPALIALRYSRTGTKQSFVAFINMFSIVGITLGIASLIVVISVMNGLEGQLKKRILGLVPHVVVDNREAIDLPNSFDADVIAQVPYIEQEVIVQSRTQVAGVYLQGVDTQQTNFSIVANTPVSGSYADITAGSFKVAISYILASKLDVKIGQQLRLISTSSSTHSILGRIPSQRLVTIAYIFNVESEMDDKVMLMDIQDAARLARKRSTQIQQQRLYLQDAFEYQALASYLESNNYEVHTWRERQGPLFDAVKMEKNMMALMLLLVIAVAAFNVVSALVMVVAEKKADIAILQTQGMRKGQLMQIFFFNGIFNSLKGVVLGIGLGLLSCYFLNDILELLGTNLAFGENGQGLPIDVQVPQLLAISFGSVAICILASWYPAAKAQAIEPAHSLRSE